MRRFTTAAETVHNFGGETTGTITTLEGKIPSRCRRKIDATAPASPRKMAIPAGRNFASCYMELCKQQRLRPLPVICVTLPHSLDFTTDRVKMDDWGPILNSLSLDRSLKSISIHSRLQNNWLHYPLVSDVSQSVDSFTRFFNYFLIIYLAVC